MQRFIRWFPSILVFAFIFWSSSRRGTLVTDVYIWNYLFHKFAHIGVYFVLTFTLYRSTKSSFQSFLIVLLYAITDEIHQSFVPTRGSRWSDVLLDSAASGYAVLILWKFYRYLPKKLKNWLEY